MTDDRSARGQTAVLGIVLLIGVVAVSSIGILLVASETTSEIKSQSETDRVETAFVELSQQMAEAATSSDASKSLELEAGERGAVAKEDTGWIRIEADDLEQPLNLSVGAIEYVGDDGTILAYQAGGVWRERGNETRMVSAPPIHYNSGDETFTFPVVTVSGEETLGSGDISIAHEQTETFANATVIEDSSVTITVQSDYYRGWQSYFERQAGAPVIRDVDHENRTVTVRLGHIDVEEAFDSGITISDDFGSGGNPGLDESDYEYGSLPQMDPVIHEMVDHFATNASHEGTITGGTYTNGTYFADEVDLQNDLSFNLSDGNVTLVVDGNLSITDGDLVVEKWDAAGGENHTVKIYSTGNLDVDAQEVCVAPCGGAVNAEQLQIYGTSEMHVSIGTGNTPFEGVIYAARDDPFEGPNEVHQTGGCDAQVCMQSNIEFRGSIVTSSIHFQGGEGSIDFEHDPKLEGVLPDIEPEGYTLPPQLTYLNIAHHRVDVTST